MTDRRKRCLWQAGAIIGAGLASLGPSAGMLHMSAMLDGPGLGLRSGVLTSVLWACPVGTIVCVIALLKLRSYVWLGGAIGTAAILFGVLFVGGLGRLYLAYAWTGRCANGEARACYAVSTLYELGLGVARDEARAARLEQRGHALVMTRCRRRADATCCQLARARTNSLLRAHGNTLCSVLEPLCTGKAANACEVCNSQDYREVCETQHEL